jgi:hypothetical protein
LAFSCQNDVKSCKICPCSRKTEHTNTKPGAMQRMRQKRLSSVSPLQRGSHVVQLVLDDLPRTASTQPVPGAEIQRSTCIARATRCHILRTLARRVHASAAVAPGSDRTQASFRHRPRRQPRLMSRISTQPASIRTGVVHDGGCLLASAADNNLMSSAELEERRQPTLVSPSRTRSLRGSEEPECRAAGATGRRARHSRGDISFVAVVAAKVRTQTPSFVSKIVCPIPAIAAHCSLASTCINRAVSLPKREAQRSKSRDGPLCGPVT